MSLAGRLARVSAVHEEAVQTMSAREMKRVLKAGATGHLSKFAVRAFKERGYHIRVLTCSQKRLSEPGPITSPSISRDDADEVLIGESSKRERVTVVPMWMARGIVTAGQIDGFGPKGGKPSLRSYFRALHAGEPNP